MQTPNNPKKKTPVKKTKVYVSEHEAEGQWDEIDKNFHEAAADLARIMAKEESHMPNQVLPMEALQARYQKELEEKFFTYRKQIENGIFQVMKSLKELSKQDPAMLSTEVIDNINRLTGISDIINGKEAEFFEESNGDINLQEIAKISNATLEKMYLAAKHLYDQQQYKEAADAFGFLTALNADMYAFWLGLGNSEYVCKNYEAALYALSFACQVNPDDPNCHIISSRCYEEIGEIDNAINALDLALFVTANKEGFEHLVPKIESEKIRISRKK